jgi:hypothetical protein
MTLASVVFGLLLAAITPASDRPSFPLMRGCQWVVVDVRQGDGYTVIEEMLVCNGEEVRQGKQ